MTSHSRSARARAGEDRPSPGCGAAHIAASSAQPSFTGRAVEDDCGTKPRIRGLRGIDRGTSATARRRATARNRFSAPVHHASPRRGPVREHRPLRSRSRRLVGACSCAVTCDVSTNLAVARRHVSSGDDSSRVLPMLDPPKNRCTSLRTPTRTPQSESQLQGPVAGDTRGEQQRRPLAPDVSASDAAPRAPERCGMPEVRCIGDGEAIVSTPRPRSHSLTPRAVRASRTRSRRVGSTCASGAESALARPRPTTEQHSTHGVGAAARPTAHRVTVGPPTLSAESRAHTARCSAKTTIIRRRSVCGDELPRMVTDRSR